MPGSFRLNYDGVGDMLCSPGMQAEMLRRAKKVRVRAEQTAPVGDQDDPHRDRFKRSFRATSGVRRGRSRRAVGTVRSTDPASLEKELGTRDTPRHRTLGRALDAARD